MIHLLEVSNLTVNFDTDRGRVYALDNINLHLDKGEVLALVGESGSGKTTLGRAILNVIPCPPGEIKTGQILFQDQNILKMDERECNKKIRGKAITLIPQDPFGAANPLFTIGTQLRDIFKMPKSKKGELEMKMISLLNQLQLPSAPDLLRKYPHELSGGQLQRVMIAASLLPDPLLIIADEPTTSLDVTVEAQILQLIRKLVKERNVSVLFITHNLAVASKVSDRILVMYAGQVMEYASTSSFFTCGETSHPYSRKLLGCLPNPKGEIKDIGGAVPNLIDPPTGCRFFPRCEEGKPECSRVKPILAEKEPGHWVSCNHTIDSTR
ncbi:MAG: ABC transporter ATP-binding protein [Thermodesulfobacteriota bacterium]